MSEEGETSRSDLLALTTQIVAAHLSNNEVAQGEVGSLIQSIFDKLNQLAKDDGGAPVELTPAVPIRRSVTDDHIVCLEDGKKLKMLKRHLMTDHGMTPEEYRERWGLRPDYPMVAPAYARTRQELAKKSGLGRKPEIVEPGPAPKAATKPRAKNAAA